MNYFDDTSDSRSEHRAATADGDRKEMDRDRRKYLKLVGTGALIGLVGSSGSGIAQTIGASPQRTLTIEATGSLATYEFAVGGNVEKSTAMGATINPNDDVSDGAVTGSVNNSGRDSYVFTGELQSFSVDGDVRLYLNGEPLTDTITVEDASSGPTEYELHVDGEVLKSTAMSASINASDDITSRNDSDQIEANQLDGEPLAGETYVSGRVAGGTDSYAISGEPTGFVANDGVTVYLNGEPVAPENFQRNVLTIEGTGSGASYEVSVSGDLAKSTWMNATLNSNDVIENGTASGTVVGGRDSFVFTGEITDFTADSSIVVYLNSEEIDASALGRDPQFENTLTIEGTGGRTDYRFAVEGSLEENYGLAAADTIDGNLATGYVVSAQDSYTFSGDITSFRTEGDGTFITYLNGQEVDPETLGRTQTTPDASDLLHRVEISGLADEEIEYGIGVTETLATGDDTETWSGDNAAYDYARGEVSSDRDVLRFAGDLATVTDFDRIEIDIDHSERTIRVADLAANASTPAKYELATSGELQPGGETESSGTDIDQTYGGTVSGRILDEADKYEFTGEVLGLQINDSLAVDISRET